MNATVPISSRRRLRNTNVCTNSRWRNVIVTSPSVQIDWYIRYSFSFRGSGNDDTAVFVMC